MPIQIIESKKLSEHENIWLKNLSNDLNTTGPCKADGRDIQTREGRRAWGVCKGDLFGKPGNGTGGSKNE
jgi:hypothetical protein